MSEKPSRKFSPKALAALLGVFALAVAAWAIFTTIDPKGPEFDGTGAQATAEPDTQRE